MLTDVAITQNLARLPNAMLIDCTRSVRALDAVCSFGALDQADYLDLDWAPRLLRLVVHEAAVPEDLGAALDLAMAGRGEVNPAYRDVSNGVWEHPVSSLSPEEVHAVNGSLRDLARRAPLTQAGVRRGLHDVHENELPQDPFDYLRKHFAALCDFYAGAATRHLAVVMWQD